MAAASHANHIVEFEERKLLGVLLQSAQLPQKKERSAMEIFERGSQLRKSILPTNNSWLLKKYFLEKPFSRSGQTKSGRD